MAQPAKRTGERPRRYRLIVEYNGSRYSGWQIQKNARTVQGTLADAIRRAAGVAPLELYGSGRTDAGVHALHQVAHLDVTAALDPERLRREINDELPADIHVIDLAPAPARFHARHDAVARRYLYQIATRRTAFGKPFVWWVREPLRLDWMSEAAARLVGLHDFRSFTDAEPGAQSTEVRLESVVVIDRGALVLIRIDGSHFLWKMVRRLVGVLVAIGRGDLTAGDLDRFLRETSGVPARLTAPASGLFLERVFYAGDPREHPIRPVVWIE